MQNFTSLCYATFEKTDHENTQFQCPVTNAKHEKIYIIDNGGKKLNFFNWYQWGPQF